MKKKRILEGIGGLVVMAMAFSYNMSQPNSVGDVSLLSIKAMTDAAAECTGTSEEGFYCNEFADGNDYCTFGGGVNEWCPKK